MSFMVILSWPKIINVVRLELFAGKLKFKCQKYEVCRLTVVGEAFVRFLKKQAIIFETFLITKDKDKRMFVHKTIK